MFPRTTIDILNFFPPPIVFLLTRILACKNTDQKDTKWRGCLIPYQYFWFIALSLFKNKLHTAILFLVSEEFIFFELLRSPRTKEARNSKKRTPNNRRRIDAHRKKSAMLECNKNKQWLHCCMRFVNQENDFTCELFFYVQYLPCW